MPTPPILALRATGGGLAPDHQSIQQEIAAFEGFQGVPLVWRTSASVSGIHTPSARLNLAATRQMRKTPRTTRSRLRPSSAPPRFLSLVRGPTFYE
jgi:hypothetical protein